jgi:hypothetical protein
VKSVHHFRDPKSGDTFTIELDLNVSEIANTMAARLRRSKTGKSRSMNGDIKARIISRNKEEKR